jgi:AcrR family transcriptional regulator
MTLPTASRGRHDSADDAARPVPPRERDAVSVRRAERRARLVVAGRSLMRERGSTEFTVPEIVARARTSLRAYYENFDKKDDLLLAVFAEAILETSAGLERATAAVDDPLARLEAYVRQLFGGTFDDHHPETSAMIALHLRLATEQPVALAEAFAPQMRVLTAIMRDGGEAGVFRRDTPPEVLAMLVSQLLVSVVHSLALGRALMARSASVDDVVQFCRNAVVADPAGPRATTARRRTTRR